MVSATTTTMALSAIQTVSRYLSCKIIHLSEPISAISKQQFNAAKQTGWWHSIQSIDFQQFKINVLNSSCFLMELSSLPVCKRHWSVNAINGNSRCAWFTCASMVVHIRLHQLTINDKSVAKVAFADEICKLVDYFAHWFTMIKARSSNHDSIRDFSNWIFEYMQIFILATRRDRLHLLQLISWQHTQQ